MALLERFHRLILDAGNGIAAVGLDHDAKQGVGVEHGLGQRNRDDDQFVGVHAQPLASRFEDADDAQPAVADANELADGRIVAEHFLADLGADDGDRRAPIPVLFRQGLPLGDFEIADRDKFGRRAGDHDFAQLAAEVDFRGADGERGDAADPRQAAQAAGVVDGQVARRAGDGIGGIEAAGARTAGQDNDQVGAERGKLGDDVAPRTVAQCREDDDGGDADRHGENRERRAHRVAGGGITGEAQGVGQAHEVALALIPTVNRKFGPNLAWLSAVNRLSVARLP